MKTALRLIHFLRPLSGWVVFSVLLSAGTIAANIGLLGTSAFLIARAAAHPSVAELAVAIVGVRFFGIARSGLRYLERLVSHSTNFRLLAELRAWFFQKLEPLAPARLINQRGGDLLDRVVADIDGLEDFYVRGVAPPLTALLVTMGMGIFVGSSYPQLGTALAAGLVLSGVGVPWLAQRLGRQPGNALIKARSAVSAEIVDSILGLADLMAFGQEERSLDNLRIANRKVGKAQGQMALRSGLVSGLNSLATHLTLWVILLAAIPLVRTGGLDAITLAVVTLVTLASFEATQPLGQASNRLQAALASADRLFEITSLTPVVIEPEIPAPAPVKAHLQIEALSFRYQAGLASVLDEVSLNLPVGKRVGIVGPSGSGKTTLFNILLRFWQPTQGRIRLDGREINQYSSVDVRRQFGVIGQNPYIFSGSVRANLSIGCPNAAPEALERVLHQTRLWEWVESLPHGLDTWMGERGVQISGGERQRLAIARVLLQDAPIWLLDEPTTHLDERTRLEIEKMVLETAGRRSMIWITHELSELAQMDEILVLKDGKVLERGTPMQLAELGGWFSRWRKITIL